MLILITWSVTHGGRFTYQKSACSENVWKTYVGQADEQVKNIIPSVTVVWGIINNYGKQDVTQ